MPDWWNRRARGLGGTLRIPVSCGGEENLLCLRNDRYYGDDIFFHETAHAVAVCIKIQNAFVAVIFVRASMCSSTQRLCFSVYSAGEENLYVSADEVCGSK